MRFQKRLLGRMQVGAVERRSAGHAAHRKHLQFDSLTGKIRIGLIPVNLRFDALPPSKGRLCANPSDQSKKWRWYLGDAGGSDVDGEPRLAVVRDELLFKSRDLGAAGQGSSL
jgi:hypothetical protein